MAVNPQEQGFFSARQRVIAEIAERQGISVPDVYALLKSPGSAMYAGEATTPPHNALDAAPFVPDVNSEFTPEQMVLLEKWMSEEIEEHTNEHAKA